MAKDDPNIDDEMQALFAALYLRLYLASGASVDTINAKSLTAPLPALPEPRSILSPIYGEYRDKICQWLKERLGVIAGGVVCAILEKTLRAIARGVGQAQSDINHLKHGMSPRTVCMFASSECTACAV